MKLGEEFAVNAEEKNEIDIVSDVSSGTSEGEKEEKSSGFEISFDWLNAPTGKGSIEDYIEEPLNFNNSRSVARILRGLTGICGELNKAVIDIVLGIFEFMREKRKNGSEQVY